MEPEHHHLLPVFRACPPLKAPIRIVPFPFVIFFRPKFTRRAHTHTRTHWLRSFPVSTATMPPFLLRSFFSPLLPANSLRFQLQTLVRPFLIIFQLPTPLVLPFSSTIHPEFNFSSLSLSRSKISNGGEIFATGRNAAETFRSSVLAGSQFRRIRRRIGKNREKRGGKERTKLNL